MNIRNFTVLCFLLCIVKSSFSQQLIVEAVYYDPDEMPYKIERKYIDNNIVTYLIHNNKSSVCVKKRTQFRGDTTIVTESYYYIFNVKTKTEQFYDCDSWITSSNNAGDSIWLSGYKTDIIGDSIILVGDTLFTGKAIEKNLDFPNKVKTARIPLILRGKITGNFDSLILNERVLTYFLNDIPVKIEIYDSEGNLLSIRTCLIDQSKLIYQKYFTGDNELKPHEIDTISWNSDTTRIKWSSSVLESNKAYKIHFSEFLISGNELQIVYNETEKKKIQFLSDANIFQNILIQNLIYNDPFYGPELRYFDLEKIEKVTANGHTSTNKYTFDDQKRIAKQNHYSDGQLQKRIVYNYGDEAVKSDNK